MYCKFDISYTLMKIPYSNGSRQFLILAKIWTIKVQLKQIDQLIKINSNK